MSYWLIKSEPDTFSLSDLKKQKTSMWEGVRNYQARNNLQAMKKGDLCLFYHSNIGKEIVGIAEVVKEHYPDPTSTEKAADGTPKWSTVSVKFISELKRPITLEKIKQTTSLKDMVLVKSSRLSVQPVKASEYKTIVKMSEA